MTSSTKTTYEVSDKDAPHWPSGVRKGRASCCGGADGRACCVDSAPVCLCGHVEPTALKMLAHIRTWNSAIRYGPVFRRIHLDMPLVGVDYRVPGHALTRFQNGLRPNQYRVKCACEWSTPWVAGRVQAVKLARLHVQETCCMLLGLDARASERHP